MNGATTTIALFDFKLETIFRAQPLGDGFVDGLIDVGHHFQLDQVSDELKRFLLQLLCELANDDRGLERDDHCALGRVIDWAGGLRWTT